jgi:hypothetical protein
MGLDLSLVCVFKFFKPHHFTQAVTMKWVTRDHVHLDRMACVWLIKRFVDPEASFTFVPWGQESLRSASDIAFSIPGTELSPHDENGTTFQKISRKYNLQDPALEELAQVIQKGVDHVLHDFQHPAEDSHGQIAVGLLAISEGLMLSRASDEEVIKANTPIYDALYDNFKVHAIVQKNKLEIPANQGLGPTLPTQFLRKVLREHP